MKAHLTVLIVALSTACVAHARDVVPYQQPATSASAQQTSTSQSVAQGSITFAQNPQDQHLTETVHNVSAPVLGAYAGSFSQMGCGSTSQAGIAVAGLSLVGGASRSMQDCVSEVAANETMKQSTADPEHAPQLRAAAIGIRCQVSRAVWLAYRKAGLDCMGLTPDDLKRTDTQPESTKVAGE